MASKKFQFKTPAEPTVVASGETYTPHEVKDGKTALAAVLHMTLAHTADVFHGILDAVSDHYKISKDEMMDVVLNHPSYKAITMSPALNDLGYFQPAVDASSAPPKQKKKFIVKKTPATAEPSSE